MLQMDYFQQIYIINLAHRSDRRLEMATQLNSIGLSFHSHNIMLFPAVRPDNSAGFPSIGARGCFLSHLGVLRDAAAKGFDRILILEDDLNFSVGFTERIGGITNALELGDWDIFYGGYFLTSALPKLPACTEVARIDPTFEIQTSHFIGFQGDAIDKASKFLDTLLSREAGDKDGGPMHVDGAYNWFRRIYSDQTTLLAVPELGYQRSSRTDIHVLRWFDRLPGFSQTVAGLRSLRNKFFR